MNDSISRQAAIDAVNSIKRTDNWRAAVSMVLFDLPSAQPDLQEYSVWFYIGETLVDVSKMHITAEEGIEKIRSYLMRMKKPERKKGNWIEQDDGWDGVYYECSVCKEAFTLIDGTPQDNLYNFCPNCGADMRGEEDE